MLEAGGYRDVDSDGNEYMDFVSSATVFNVSHLREDVIKAIKEQLNRYMVYSLVYFYAYKVHYFLGFNN